MCLWLYIWNANILQQRCLFLSKVSERKKNDDEQIHRWKCCVEHACTRDKFDSHGNTNVTEWNNQDSQQNTQWQARKCWRKHVHNVIKIEAHSTQMNMISNERTSRRTSEWMNETSWAKARIGAFVYCWLGALRNVSVIFLFYRYAPIYPPKRSVFGFYPFVFIVSFYHIYVDVIAKQSILSFERMYELWTSITI